VVRWLLDGWLPPVGVGVVAFAAARLAMLPGLGFWDTAELQAVAPLLGTAHPTGYPTYVILGWLTNIVLTPFGEPALRMNMFAGLSVAIAAAVTVDLVRTLTRSAMLGVAAGVGLAFTTVVWRIALQAEAHALHLALTAILFRLLVAWEDDRRDRTLVAAAVVFGLALGNHSLSLLLVPPIGLYVLAVEPAVIRRPGMVGGAMVAFVVTVVLVFLELPLRAGPFRAQVVYGHPETWDGFWYVALAEQFRGSLMGPFGDLGTKAAALAGRTTAAFGPITGLIPIGFGATLVMRPSYALLSGTAALITVFFAASYDNAAIERYYLVPALIAWTWLAILAAGVATLIGRNLGESRRPQPVIAAALGVVLLVPTVTDIPARFRAIDRSHDVAAPAWIDRALVSMAPDAVIVSWWSYSTPLWYAQSVQGRRPDIDIIDDRTRIDQDLGTITDVIDANLPTRPVYVIRLDPSEIAALEQRYTLAYLDGSNASGLTRVLARKPAS
jgi:transmembrane protein TMEM260 (protein O-mannosyltransferase)